MSLKYEPSSEQLHISDLGPYGRQPLGTYRVGPSDKVTESQPDSVGLDVIRKEAWPFYRTISGVRLCWELEEPKGPKGDVFACDSVQKL